MPSSLWSARFGASFGHFLPKFSRKRLRKLSCHELLMLFVVLLFGLLMFSFFLPFTENPYAGLVRPLKVQEEVFNYYDPASLNDSRYGEQANERGSLVVLLFLCL